MKKRLEHEELLHEMLAEAGDARATSFSHGLAALRRTRVRRRTARLALSVIPILLLAGLWISQNHRVSPSQTAQSPEPTPAAPAQLAKMIEGTPIRVISDEELLAVFQGRPVALLGEPGHQRLVLLDEPVRRQ